MSETPEIPPPELLEPPEMPDMPETMATKEMSPDDQWTEINYSRGFLTATLDRIKEVRETMLAIPAEADEVRTHVNDVPISVRAGNENFIHIEIGTTRQGDPQVILDIPISWVMNV